MLVNEKLRILGVDCPSCIYSINKGLRSLNGVKEFKADVVSGEAVIEYDDGVTSLADIVRVIRASGYDVLKETLSVVVDVGDEELPQVEWRIKGLRGIIDCSTSHISKVIRITYNPYTTSADLIKGRLRELGIEFSEVSQAISEGSIKRGPNKYLMITSFTLGVLAIAYHLIGLTYHEVWLMSFKDLTLSIIASIVYIINKELIMRGLRSLIRGTPSMDSLIALSATSSYVFSIAMMLGLLNYSETFFEASAGVLGFVSLGKYLELRLRSKALRSMEDLTKVQLKSVKVLRDGVLKEVDISEVVVGDVAEVRAGEVIPVDGVVVDGWGYVDESMFTGESVPRFKGSEGRDPVLAGSILTSGYLRVRVTRVGGDTLLSRIVEVIREAQFTKPRYQLIADRVVGLLTWVVIALSILTFAYWSIVEGDLERAVLSLAAVLAVTCPCPLGIAIPMVTSIAVYEAVKLGLLIKGGDVFERILSINVAIFDKTGTLTVGRPEVRGVRVFNQLSKEDVLKLICSAEVRSEHPLAKSIINYCSEEGVEFNDPDSYEHVPGMGVIAKVGNSEVVIGSDKLLEGMEVGILDSIREYLSRLRNEGYTVVLVAIDRELAAAILIRDKLRDDAGEVINFMRMKGIKTIIASGDSKLSVEALARELEVDEAYGELTPEDKVDLINRHQMRGERTAFIGDGVNDAAAISKAFIGIAMGRGSSISKEAGDVVIVNDDLRSIKDLYELSIMVRRKSLENLTWAFIYNLALIPVAMGLFYSYGLFLRPEYAAISMILSDISVILNSTTLLKWRKHKLG